MRRYAAESHPRARARDAGRFEDEILPLFPLGAKRRARRPLRHDDSIRDDQSPQKLAKLRPYFEKPDGVVTVGNACGSRTEPGP